MTRINAATNSACVQLEERVRAFYQEHLELEDTSAGYVAVRWPVSLSSELARVFELENELADDFAIFFMGVSFESEAHALEELVSLTLHQLTSKGPEPEA